MVSAGPDLVEEFAVDLACFLPFLDIRHEHPGPDHVGCLTTQRLDRGDDNIERTPGLPFHGRGVTAVGLDAHRPRDRDEVPARIARE